MKLRAAWLQVHKWIGILLAILIIPVSITGSLLVWHDGLDALANPGRYAVTGDTVLAPSAYANAARAALTDGERIASVRMPEHDGPVIVSAVAPARGDGPPVRSSLYFDPPTAQLLDRSTGNEGLVRVLHVLHGSLMVPGLGRQIVGWIGVAMLISCLTGIWLWWPVTGSVTRGFRWKRQNSINANLHHQMGFWVLIPLAMLSFTGAWISFPQFFGQLSGAQQQQQKGGGQDKARRMRAQPLAETRIDVDGVVALAAPAANGTPLVMVTWPTDQSGEWQAQFEREGGNAEVRVGDATREITPPRPPQPETIARVMRRWHDGQGMGWIWQFVIFLGGIIPCILSVTGIYMWLRSRSWRAELKKKRKARAQREPVPAAAE